MCLECMQTVLANTMLMYSNLRRTYQVRTWYDECASPTNINMILGCHIGTSHLLFLLLKVVVRWGGEPSGLGCLVPLAM